MNPILINLGFIEIRWYAFLILTAFIITQIIKYRYTFNKMN